VRWLIAASVATVPITLTHAVEDFSVGIHERFHLPVLLAAFFVSLAYAAQVLAAALAAQERRLGYWLNLGLALAWLVGAAADHLGEVVFVSPYRHGLLSKALEVAIMVGAALWAGLAISALRASGRKQPM